MILKVQDMLKLPKFFHKNIEKMKLLKLFYQRVVEFLETFQLNCFFRHFGCTVPKKWLKTKKNRPLELKALYYNIFTDFFKVTSPIKR